MKDIKGITITNALQKILDERGRKPNKILLDQSSDFCSRSMKLWLHDFSGIVMHSTHNKDNLLLLRDFSEL